MSRPPILKVIWAAVVGAAVPMVAANLLLVWAPGWNWYHGVLQLDGGVLLAALLLGFVVALFLSLTRTSEPLVRKVAFAVGGVAALGSSLAFVVAGLWALSHLR